MSDDIMRTLDDAPLSPECETVDARLADYLDDAPDPALVAEVDAHLARCRRCAALVSDLTGISAAARALPPLRPARDLWAGIAHRIDAAPVVVPIETAREQRRVRALPARWLSLAAAAALVFVTAGVTYIATKMSMDSGAAATPVAPNVAVTGTRGDTSTALAPANPALASAADTHRPPTSSSSAEALRSGAAPGGTMRSVSNDGRTRVAAPAANSAYDLEISRLRKIVRERRSELDPATLAVLDRNIKIIDDAIAQSRAALRRDPGSRFLDEQLNDALDKKVELLRMAALMPART